MPHAATDTDKAEVTLEAKVAFMSDPAAYPFAVQRVIVKETHMSWVFLAGGRVYKLKKPIRSPSQDFSTGKRREAACRAEFRLNRRLAKATYLDVVSLTISGSGLAIGGEGQAVDWLVVMRRLDERLMLEEKLLQESLQKHEIDRLAETLADFYRHAMPSPLAPAQHVAELRKNLNQNRRILLDAKLKLPGGLVRKIDRLQADFLVRSAELIIDRSRARLIVDAHGDLRPEHIWLGKPLQIIDCLEFNERLRTLDALSEIAFLDLECERLDAAWAGDRLQKRIFGRRPDLNNEALFHFYRSYHAMVRARLAIAHLLETHPRKPTKWRPLALSYLGFAVADARKLPDFVRTRACRSVPGLRIAEERFQRATGLKGECRFS
jgi:aminoglycoside phosphotransferase family enzyme